MTWPSSSNNKRKNRCKPVREGASRAIDPTSWICGCSRTRRLSPSFTRQNREPMDGWPGLDCKASLQGHSCSFEKGYSELMVSMTGKQTPRFGLELADTRGRTRAIDFRTRSGRAAAQRRCKSGPGPLYHSRYRSLPPANVLVCLCPLITYRMQAHFRIWVMNGWPSAASNSCS